MTRWYGKLLRLHRRLAAAAAIPCGALIGLLIGHAFDADWFRSSPRQPYRVLGLTDEASDARGRPGLSPADLAIPSRQALRRRRATCATRPSARRARSTAPTTASRPCAGASEPMPASIDHRPDSAYANRPQLHHRPVHPLRRLRQARRRGRQRARGRRRLGALRRDGQPLRAQPHHRPAGVRGAAQARRHRADRRAPDGAAGGPHRSRLRQAPARIADQLPSRGQRARAPHRSS